MYLSHVGPSGPSQGKHQPHKENRTSSSRSKVSLDSLRATQQVECLLIAETTSPPTQEKSHSFTHAEYKRLLSDIKRRSIYQADYQGPYLQQKLKGILLDIVW